MLVAGLSYPLCGVPRVGEHRQVVLSVFSAVTSVLEKVSPWIRLDPTKSEYDVWYDDEAGQTNVTISEGTLDYATDSLSPEPVGTAAVEV